MELRANASTSTPIVGADGSEAGYALIGKLAVGGMAELFLARRADAGRREPVVVLKRILPHLAEDPEFVRMFHDEAHLAATLEHPHIVRVFDLGRHGRDYFFTMEYVHGENVRALLRAAEQREEAIPLPHVLTIMRGVTAGLHYAHERRDDRGEPLQIVHRDVSPTNVLVGYDGAVKLVDFGIAKAAAGTHVTQAGMLKGKAAYMAPEQCRADPVDRRSDVFALGILLYEMSTLTRLFRGDNELAILHQVLSGNIDPPSKRRRDYPPELERIVLRALRLDPAERYPTALALQEDLEAFARGHGLHRGQGELAQYMVRTFGDRPLPWPVEPEREEPTRAEVPSRPAPAPARTGVTTPAPSRGGPSLRATAFLRPAPPPPAPVRPGPRPPRRRAASAFRPPGSEAEPQVTAPAPPPNRTARWAPPHAELPAGPGPVAPPLAEPPAGPGPVAPPRASSPTVFAGPRGQARTVAAPLPLPALPAKRPPGRGRGRALWVAFFLLACALGGAVGWSILLARASSSAAAEPRRAPPSPDPAGA